MIQSMESRRDVVVAITGDREWGTLVQEGVIRRALSCLDPATCRVVLGDARGVDALARSACKDLELRYSRHKADWGRYGRGAGPKRNAAMLADGPPDELWFFHADLSQSKGTANCVRQAERLGITIRNGQELAESVGVR